MNFLGKWFTAPHGKKFPRAYDLKCFKSSEFSWNVPEKINCKSCEVACFCLMQIGHISKNDSVS